MNQELIDVLGKVRNERKSTAIEIESKPASESKSSIESGFGFGFGIFGVILLATVAPFILSAFIAAVASPDFGLENPHPAKTTHGDLVMYMTIAYAIIGFLGFIWYTARKQETR